MPSPRAPATRLAVYCLLSLLLGQHICISAQAKRSTHGKHRSTTVSGQCCSPFTDHTTTQLSLIIACSVFYALLQSRL